MSFEDEYNK